MFEKEIIVDGRGHLLGRLASVVAKEILSGQRVVIVRCDQLLRSGSLFRNKLKYGEYLNKGNASNPRKGQFHFRAPSRIFWKSVRGMLPHKTARGAAALGRLKVFDGIPFPYDMKRRLVVPSALKISQLRDQRKYCKLGDLAEIVGWTKKAVVDRLEDRRREKSAKYYTLKQKKVEARLKTKGSKELASFNTELAKFGF